MKHNQYSVAYEGSLLEGSVFDGNQIWWHFEDWEASIYDNLSLTILRPHRMKEIELAQDLVLANPSYAHLAKLADEYYTVCSDQWVFMDDGWNAYVPLLEHVLEMMNEISPNNFDVRLLYAIAIEMHHEQGVDEVYKLPVSLDFLDDVMFEIMQVDDANRTELQNTVFAQLDWYYYFYYDDYETRFEGYESKGIEIPSAS